ACGCMIRSMCAVPGTMTSAAPSADCSWRAMARGVRSVFSPTRMIVGHGDSANHAIVEAHHELGIEIHSPRPADDNPHKIGAVRRRHEIDNRRAAGLSLEFGFEHEGAGTILPSDAKRRMLWSNEPPAIIRCPEQGGKAGS